MAGRGHKRGAEGDPPDGSSKAKQAKNKNKSGEPAGSSTSQHHPTAPTPDKLKKVTVVILEGIKVEAFHNTLTLQKELERSKPCIAMCDLKPGRNNTVIVTAKTMTDFSELLKPWKKNQYLGTVLPRLPKEQRPKNQFYSVIAKNVPIAIQTRELEEELSKQGFGPSIITRFQRKLEDSTQQTLKVVKIDLCNERDQTRLIEQGFKLGFLKIQPEAYQIRSSNQCFKCQEWGHSHSDCTKPSKCRWCAGSHDSRSCPNPNGLKRCANCTGGHPSHWSGCPARTTKNVTKPKPTPHTGTTPQVKKQVPEQPKKVTKPSGQSEDETQRMYEFIHEFPSMLSMALYRCLRDFGQSPELLGMPELKALVCKNMNKSFGTKLIVIDPDSEDEDDDVDHDMSSSTVASEVVEGQRPPPPGMVTTELNADTVVISTPDHTKQA